MEAGSIHVCKTQDIVAIGKEWLIGQYCALLHTEGADRSSLCVFFVPIFLRGVRISHTLDDYEQDSFKDA